MREQNHELLGCRGRCEKSHKQQNKRRLKCQSEVVEAGAVVVRAVASDAEMAAVADVAIEVHVDSRAVGNSRTNRKRNENFWTAVTSILA